MSKKRIQEPVYLHSISFFSSCLVCAFCLLSLPSLPSPPFSLSSQHLAHYYTANSDDLHDKVDGHPVVDGVRSLQQHKAHAHVVVGPHLQEPVDPVEDVLSTRTQFGSDWSLHGWLSCDAQGDGEEGQVVSCMQAVPVGADEHGPARPESYRQMGSILVGVSIIRSLVWLYLCIKSTGPLSVQWHKTDSYKCWPTHSSLKTLGSHCNVDGKYNFQRKWPCLYYHLLCNSVLLLSLSLSFLFLVHRVCAAKQL